MKNFKSFVLCGLFLIAGLNAQNSYGAVNDEPKGTPISFNGTDQYVVITSHDDFNIALSESFTLSYWVKFDEYREIARAQRMLSKRGSVEMPPKNGYEFFGGLDADRLVAVNAPNDEGRYTNSMSVWTQPKGNSIDTWYHIAFVVDRAAGKMYFYHDGTRVESSTDISPWYVDNGFDVIVGAGRNTNNAAIDYFLKGSIANVRFWKKALSQEEIAEDREADTPSKENLVAAYDFSKIDGLTLKDISGNGHDGALVGFEPFTGIEETQKDAVKAYIDNDGLIHVQGTADKSTAELYDISGKLLVRSDLSSSNSLINASSLPSSVYILKVYTGNGIPVVKKLIK